MELEAKRHFSFSADFAMLCGTRFQPGIGRR
jgi:hypothetical protein